MFAFLGRRNIVRSCPDRVDVRASATSLFTAARRRFARKDVGPNRDEMGRFPAPCDGTLAHSANAITIRSCPHASSSGNVPTLCPLFVWTRRRAGS
ncbi:hypothetical protein [Lysobacter gummosus]|uniref:hypothetical protein n=1 Tax=Lysobacter gummosus TaxID=262324 RepID=UPI003639E96E